MATLRAWRKSGGSGTVYLLRRFGFPKNKPPLTVSRAGVEGVNSLTMSYFHTGTRTIIGAEAFHGPVRDGKGWDHLAMVIRLDLLPRWSWGPAAANS
jgi:hypothetical protein